MKALLGDPNGDPSGDPNGDPNGDPDGDPSGDPNEMLDPPGRWATGPTFWVGASGCVVPWTMARGFLCVFHFCCVLKNESVLSWKQKAADLQVGRCVTAETAK